MDTIAPTLDGLATVALRRLRRHLAVGHARRVGMVVRATHTRVCRASVARQLLYLALQLLYLHQFLLQTDLHKHLLPTPATP